MDAWIDANITVIEPISEICSVLVNVHGAIDLESITESVMLAIAVANFGHYEHTGEFKYNKKEGESKKLSLIMEMILRNIIINDEYAARLKDHELLGYLMAKAYLITGIYPSPDFVRSVIKIYRIFLNDRENSYTCLK